MESKNKDELVLGGTGQRLINYVIDVFFINAVSLYLAHTLLGVDLAQFQYPFEITTDYFLVHAGCTLSYYLIFEFFLNKSFGKFITGTRVMDLEGGKPTLKIVFLRSLVRLLDIFYVLPSLFMLITRNITLHDLLSQTRVVDEKESQLF